MFPDMLCLLLFFTDLLTHLPTYYLLLLLLAVTINTLIILLLLLLCCYHISSMTADIVVNANTTATATTTATVAVESATMITIHITYRSSTRDSIPWMIQSSSYCT